MRRIVLLFAYVGAVVFAGAVALSLFSLDFVCYFAMMSVPLRLICPLRSGAA